MKFLTQPLYAWYRSTIRNSKYRWLIIVGSLLYLFSPFNVLTDALPIVGWIDDSVIVTLLVTEVSQFLLEQLKTQRAKDSSTTVVG